MVKSFDERFIYGIALLFFIFARVNFDADLGTIFAFMAVFNLVIFSLDKFPTIFIEKTRNLGRSLLLAVLAYVGFIGISIVTLPFLKGALQITQAITLTSVLDILIETQQTLALEGFIPLQFVAFGVLVPVVETGMLGTFLELLKDRFKINIRELSFQTISLFVGLALMFVIFHLSSKGVTNFPALWMVGLFAMVTFVLIFIEGQLMAAMLFHIIANSLALMMKFGLAPSIFIAAIYVAVGVLAFFILAGRFSITKLRFT